MAHASYEIKTVGPVSAQHRCQIDSRYAELQEYAEKGAK